MTFIIMLDEVRKFYVVFQANECVADLLLHVKEDSRLVLESVGTDGVSHLDMRCYEQMAS